MTPSGVAAVTFAFLAGCGSSGDPSPPPPLVPADAAPVDSLPTGITELPTFDPATGMHLDLDQREDAEGTSQPRPRPRSRSSRVLGILLRSTPSGAIAAVDGQPLGPTPTYWEGEFTGGEREFTFALAGYAVARYRFVPTTSGVIYGRLVPIAAAAGAGMPAIPKPAPSARPSDRPGPAAPGPASTSTTPIKAPEPDEPEPSEPVESAKPVSPIAAPVDAAVSEPDATR